MKKIIFLLLFIVILFSGCAQKENTKADILRIGDTFSLTGVVDYSDEPSDIGQEYCFITGTEEIEYYYTDIYSEESKWKSKVFYTQGDDTTFLKDYIGKKITVSGVFDAECHGIPYITSITVLDN